MMEGSKTVGEGAHNVVDGYAERGIRCLAVCRTKEFQCKGTVDPQTGFHSSKMIDAVLPPGEADPKWEYLGVITFMDPPRDDTKETVRLAKELNVQVKMITGDQQKIGKNMAIEIELGPTRGTADIQVHPRPRPGTPNQHTAPRFFV